MGLRERVGHELRSLALVTLYFACWLGTLATIKWLILAEYHVEFAGFAKAATGVLILSKVVLLLERVPLGRHVGRAPVWLAVLARTLFHVGGVFLVLVLERVVHAFLHGASSLSEAVAEAGETTNVHRVLANTLAVAASLLFYNFLSAVNRRLAPGGVWGLLRERVPEE